jgi:hypothetical protein
MPDFNYSGHETFSLRISWLPKAVASLEAGENPFSDPRVGMASLGLGKNMIQSLAFWVVATGLAERRDGKPSLTDFAKKVLSRKSGFDPFLENTQTLWLIHWNLCQGWNEEAKRRCAYAWHFFANLLTSDEITATEAVDHFAAGATPSGKELSSVTLRQHFDVFIKTYVEGENAGPRSTPEDSLDSPLTTIGLIKESGDRKLPGGKRETVYRFNTSAKPSLSNKTFRYCLHEWWDRNCKNDSSLTVRQVAHDPDSPGRCFRLPETSIHKILADLAKAFPDEFEMIESRNQRAVRRKRQPSAETLLKSVYSQ